MKSRKKQSSSYSVVDYKNEYTRQNYDRILLIVPKGMKEDIKKKAAKDGFSSVNAFINALITESFAEDKEKSSR